MKTNLVRALCAMFCIVAFVSPASALKLIRGQHTDLQRQGVGGIHVTVYRVAPDGTEVAVSPGISDANGQVLVDGLTSGNYVLVVDGSSMADAMETVIGTPKKRDSGSSVSLSIGGGLFGGSKRSENQTNGHPGLPAGSSHDSTSSGGGVGVGMNIPIGGNPDTNPIAPTLKISVGVGTPEATRTWISGVGDDEPGMITFSSSYCADSAKQGMSFAFAVPEGNPPETFIVFFDFDKAT